MKLRRRADDFLVQELTDFQPSRGLFAFYLLEKQSLGTLEAVQAICRKWRLPRQAVSFGGLKDKHAHTRQHLTIAGGPRRSLRQERFSLTYLGPAARSFHASDIRGNRFQITLRSLSPPAAEAALALLPQVARDGAPNYFDDQRFGSLGQSQQFVAQPWVRSDYERALWLAIADDNEHDSAQQRRAKQSLRESWSDDAARAQHAVQLGHSQVAEHLLRRPGDFRGALVRLPIDARGLHLAAFQSWIWNRMLSALLERELPEESRMPLELKPGTVWSYGELSPQQRQKLTQLALPLPSARAKEECREHLPLVEAALAPLGLSLRELRVKYPRDSFFSKGMRAAVVLPADLGGETADDEVYDGMRKLTLRFELPRGAYATMIVKRFAAAG